jgi:hypothetical protein
VQQRAANFASFFLSQERLADPRGQTLVRPILIQSKKWSEIVNYAFAKRLNSPKNQCPGKAPDGIE